MMKKLLLLFSFTLLSIHSNSQHRFSFVEDNLGLDSTSLGADTALVGNDWKSGSTNLNFVGDANVQNSVNNGEDFVANTGVGIIYDRFWYGNTNAIRQFSLSLNINVASTADSIIAQLDPSMKAMNQRDFGSYLLIPNNSRQSAALEAIVYRNLYKHNLKKNCNSIVRAYNSLVKGYIFNILGSTSTWSVRDTSYNMAGLSIKAGMFYEFISDKIRHNDGYSVKIGAMYSGRYILGDLNFTKNDRIRQELLNSNRSSFHGIEFFARFKFRNVVAQVSIPLIGPGEVEGLTKSQFVTSIQFIGGFPLSIKKQANTTLASNSLGI